MKMDLREKRLIVILILGLILLIIKSTNEGYNSNEGNSEYEFYLWVQERIENEYTGILYKNEIVKLKVISIKKLENDDGKYYVAKVRKYIFGLFPFSDVFIKEEILKI